MPKGKVIDVRPKKRKPNHKLDEPISAVPERPKRNPDHVSHSTTDRMRLFKSKNRSHNEKHFTLELPFTGQTQKRIVLISLAVIVVAALSGLLLHQYASWRWAQLVKTPLNLPRIIADGMKEDSLFWGSYRPGLYFGMKHRSPNPLIVGLIWAVHDIQNPRFRHLCDSNDGVLSYNWLEHDARHFGTQQIVDLDHIITVSFVKYSTGTTSGDGWTFRVSAIARNRTQASLPLSVIVYFYYTGEKSQYYFLPHTDGDVVTGLKGSSVHLGDHQISFHPANTSLQVSSLIAHIPREDAVMETMFTGLGVRRDTNMFSLTGRPRQVDQETHPNAWFHEVTVQPPTMSQKFEASQIGQTVIEVTFTQADSTEAEITGDLFTKRLNSLSSAFHQRFAERFPVDLTKFTERQANLSKVAVSNLLGGIGYFYGSSLIKSTYTGPEPVPGWPAALFTATPSRPMFPRGFLWDEGFHGLILARWDPQLAMESVGHWLDLMNGEGWIPREQILGDEARSRVPSQFVVQHNTVANPPALVLVIEALIESLPKFTSDEAVRFRRWSALVLPRLHTWYQWFNQTQAGATPFTYRWRGRDPKEIHQLNPLTLSSGLDDYPRASHPSEAERHLDLRCWMTLFARVVSRLASLVAQYMQTESGPLRFQKLGEARALAATYGRWADLLSDQAMLDQLHWSEASERYADYGLHTDAVRLQVPERAGRQSNSASDEELKPVRVTDKPPKLQLVTSSLGYVSLFPLLLRSIPPNSPRLPQMLADLAKQELWSDHGIRSLSIASPLYRKSNTQDDPPYWRGAIWLNMNYLAVRSLRHYASHSRTPSDVASEANLLAVRLAQNLARTVLGELERTGFLWEQYDDITGRGQRAHPFSGWTALISLLMAE
ncbi:Mannosyl-oligosaccharide glucosidase [Paragonimus heterotremus]|uniref:Mannosyl-oligosaccharide glucosidase n=1 Tax=Paragonimus heterotremus TaxID=100268 RepID=A0A8J4WJ84_9TREM|nr:Mannosyl-oligosaccharide glucosidase [Paragonimus heterotremus]